VADTTTLAAAARATHVDATSAALVGTGEEDEEEDNEMDKGEEDDEVGEGEEGDEMDQGEEGDEMDAGEEDHELQGQEEELGEGEEGDEMEEEAPAAVAAAAPAVATAIATAASPIDTVRATDLALADTLAAADATAATATAAVDDDPAVADTLAVATPVDTVHAAAAIAVAGAGAAIATRFGEEEGDDELHQEDAQAQAGGIDSDGEHGEGDGQGGDELHQEDAQAQPGGGEAEAHGEGDGQQGGTQGIEWHFIDGNERILVQTLNDQTIRVKLVLYTRFKNADNNRYALAILDDISPDIQSSKLLKQCAWVEAPEDLIGRIMASPNQACCALRDALGQGVTRGPNGINVNDWLCINADGGAIRLKLAFRNGMLAELIQPLVAAPGSQ